LRVGLFTRSWRPVESIRPQRLLFEVDIQCDFRLRRWLGGFRSLSCWRAPAIDVSLSPNSQSETHNPNDNRRQIAPHDSSFHFWRRQYATQRLTRSIAPEFTSPTRSGGPYVKETVSANRCACVCRHDRRIAGRRTRSSDPAGECRR